MTKEQFNEKIKDLNLKIFKLVQELPDNNTGKIIAEKLLSAAELLAFCYRSSMKSNTRLNFVSRLEKPQKYAEDILYWIEILADSKLIPPLLLENAAKEAKNILGTIDATRNISQRSNEELLNKIILEP